MWRGREHDEIFLGCLEKNKFSTNICITPLLPRENYKQFSESYLTPSYQSCLLLVRLKMKAK